jgi:hypothetical protein
VQRKIHFVTLRSKLDIYFYAPATTSAERGGSVNFFVSVPRATNYLCTWLDGGGGGWWWLLLRLKRFKETPIYMHQGWPKCDSSPRMNCT